jgi:hypothetical protein
MTGRSATTSSVQADMRSPSTSLRAGSLLPSFRRVEMTVWTELMRCYSVSLFAWVEQALGPAATKV